MGNIKNVIFLLCWQGMAMPAANAFEWTASDVQLLYGNDFELGDDERTTVTVEHSHGWQYGTNFFFIDAADRNDIGVEVYAEVYVYLSMSKMTGSNLSIGPVKDVSLMAGLNISNKPEQDNFKAYLLGFGFDLSNSEFGYLELDVEAYKNDSVSNRYGVQITPVWDLPFQIASTKFRFRGFTDFRIGNANASGAFDILAQPQLLLDVGDLFGWKSDKVYVGTEYSYWRNKFGIRGVDESVVQAMAIGFF